MGHRVLILGASGRAGRHCAEAFWNAGWHVTRYDRAQGDLTAAAKGADVIVNGWNPPYNRWAKDLPGLTHNVIDAARASNAMVILPGNVYVYGKSAPDVFSPATPHAATNPLGRIRIEIERQYRDSGVPFALLRAGDFLDTEASGNWFDMQMAPSLKRGVLTYPGDPSVPHAWAWLPDLARAAVALADRRASLPRVTDVSLPGFTLSGQDLAALCGQALGRPVRVRRMSWLPIRMAQPFWPLAQHLLEMRYLWDKPHRLDGAAFETLLPDFSPTDPLEAVAQAVAAALGSTPAADPPKPNHAVPGPRQEA